MELGSNQFVIKLKEGNKMDRRSFVKNGAVATAASALMGCSTPYASVKGSDRIKVGLIGCGGRLDDTDSCVKIEGHSTCIFHLQIYDLHIAGFIEGFVVEYRCIGVYLHPFIGRDPMPNDQVKIRLVENVSHLIGDIHKPRQRSAGAENSPKNEQKQAEG